MDYEEAFAEEAQEEAVLAGGGRKDGRKDDRKDNAVESSYTRGNYEDEDEDDETSPLVRPRQRRRPQRESYSKARTSYERAIHEPWTGSHDSGNQPWFKTPSIFWLLPAFFPFCIAFGGIIVPKTYLILDLICEKYLSEQASKDPTFTYLPVLFGEENPQCRDPHVQSLVANFNLYMNLLSGVFSAIVAPQLGALSDRIGRKKVLVCASFGAFMMEVITIVIGRNPGKVSVYWMLLGAFFDGISGSFTTGMALAFAYASDCSTPERRNVAFGYFHGTLFAGIALGPVLSGWLIQVTNTVMTAFYVALGCNIFYIIFITFIVPESLSKERQLLAREKRRLAKESSPHKDWAARARNYNLLEPLWVLRPKGPGSTRALRRNLFVIAAIDTMMFGVAMGTMQIIIIYAEYRFGWNAVISSMYLSSVNVCRVLGLLVVLPALTRLVRGPVTQQSAGHKGSDMLDINIIRATVIFEFIGYIGYAFTPSGVIMFISGMVASFGGIGSPTLQSSLTKAIPADRTGQVLGASGLLHALARVVAPTVFNFIYSITVGIYAGIVFICLASIFIIIFVFSWFLKPGVYLPDSLSLSLSDDENNEESTAIPEQSLTI